MPTRRDHHRPPRLAAGLLAAVVALSAAAHEQPKPADPARGGAVRLPDGAVVLFTKNSDDPNPPIDGVLLSPKEYQQLLDQAEALKKAKDAAKPVPPSACHVRARIDARKDRPVAVLKITFKYRTTAPRQVVLLGCQRAFPVAAAAGDGKQPVLEATPDGLTVMADAPGEHALTLDAEAAVTPRGVAGEPGFELGLPRAAITTLALDPPGPGVKAVTVVARTPDPAGPARTARTTDTPARFTPRPGADAGHPLGPVDHLEVLWETPAAAPQAPADAAAAVEAEVNVRVDETQVETTAKLRVRGGPRELAFVFPPGAEPTVARAAPPAGPRDPDPLDAGPTLVRPADPARPVWKLRLPDAGGEWLVTATARQPRPNPSDPKYPGPYPVGPFYAVGVPRQSGAVRVFAPVTVQFRGWKHPPQVRPQDAPGGADDDTPDAVFRYAALPAGDPPGPLLEFEAWPAKGAVAVQPAHKLTLTPGGWRLRSEVRVSPVRRRVEQLELALPAGWHDPVVLPLELVDEVRGGKDATADRVLTVRLAGDRTDPFTLVVEARFPVPAAARDAALPLPRFLGTAERGAQVAVSVPDLFEVRGSLREWDGGRPSEAPTALKPSAAAAPGPAAPGPAVTSLVGAADGGVARVELTWHPYRPELTADVRAEVAVGDRQAVVTETVRLKAADPIRRPIRLRGPASPTGFRTRPLVEPAGAPGEWEFAPPADTKETTLTISYAVPLPPRPTDGAAARAAVPLVWPDAARVEAGVRVWGAETGGGRRVVRFDGPWRELPPEPAADRDSLPCLTLEGTGPNLPLNLDLADGGEPAGVVVERAAVQAWAADDGTVQVRGRFLLRRWSAAGVELELASAGPPAVYADRVRVEPLPAPGGPGGEDGRAVRVPLPEPRPTRPTLILEVRYALPPRPAGELVLTPPRLRGAAYRSPVWWHVTLPAATVPLLPRGPAADARWRWRDLMFAPAAAVSSADLDRWFADGADPGDAATDPWPAGGGEAVTFRQPAPTAVRVVRVPRAAWVLGCSAAVLAVGVGLSRLRSGLLGPAVAAVGIVAAVAATAFPQPAARAAAAAQPGLAALAAVLAFQAGLRWYHRRRRDRQSVFTRGAVVLPPAGSGTGPKPDPSGRGSRNGVSADARSGSAPPLTPTSAS